MAAKSVEIEPENPNVVDDKRARSSSNNNNSSISVPLAIPNSSNSNPTMEKQHKHHRHHHHLHRKLSKSLVTPAAPKFGSLPETSVLQDHIPPLELPPSWTSSLEALPIQLKTKATISSTAGVAAVATSCPLQHHLHILQGQEENNKTEVSGSLTGISVLEDSMKQHQQPESPSPQDDADDDATASGLTLEEEEALMADYAEETGGIFHFEDI